MVERTLQITAILWIFTINAVGNTSNASELVVTSGEYFIKAEIIMPHLEENLRYTNTNSQKCLSREDPSSLFPLLNHASFVDCALTSKRSEGDHIEFDLVCRNPEAATGSANFVIGSDTLSGTLEVKMGGKNMKFSQRIRGHRIGSC